MNSAKRQHLNIELKFQTVNISADLLSKGREEGGSGGTPLSSFWVGANPLETLIHVAIWQGYLYENQTELQKFSMEVFSNYLHPGRSCYDPSPAPPHTQTYKLNYMMHPLFKISWSAPA